MLNFLQELFASMRANKLRTILTGFSVSWGVFMLMVLLGAAGGLNSSVMDNFAQNATNSMAIYGGNTSEPFDGLPVNRRIELLESDVDMLLNHFPQISAYSRAKNIWGVEASVGSEYASISVSGVDADYVLIRPKKILKGRALNALDDRLARKSIILSEASVDQLFHNDEPIGQTVLIKGISFTVVGVYENEGGGLYGMMPYVTMQQTISNGNTTIDAFNFIVDGVTTRQDSEAFQKQVREVLARSKRFSPTDQSAVWVWDRLGNYLQTRMVFSAISIFIWLIGIGTLTAGVVGVGNIMVVTVRERTKEFGIRKAIGAPPSSILRMVLSESLATTFLFGLLGMLLGSGILKLVQMIAGGMATPTQNDEMPNIGMTILTNMHVDLRIVLSACAVLIVSGLVAGYLPAKRAMQMKPIEALTAK